MANYSVSCFDLNDGLAAQVKRALSPLDSVTLSFHATLDAARAECLEHPCDLILGPWRSGGVCVAETLADLQMLGASKRAIALVPSSGSALADVAARTGSIELIVADPLNRRALRHRVILELQGEAGLFQHLYGAEAGADDALDMLPALRRRLAA